MTRTISTYSTSTGEFTGRTFSGPDAFLETQAGPGLAAYEGAIDARRYTVDLATGNLIKRAPARPADTADVTYVWDEGSDDWWPQLTAAALERAARATRDAMLAACDWVSLRAADTGLPVPADWAAYRAALRDISLQQGFPVQITWPQPPTT